MKIISKLFFILIFAQLTFINSTSALDIKDKNEYLIDIKGEDGNIYLNRLSLHKKIDFSKIDIYMFGETQWNFDTDEWEKLTFGAKLSKSIWKSLYVNQSLQLISGQILDHIDFNVDNSSVDTTTEVGLLLNFLEHLSFKISEDFSFNLEKCKGEYCETKAKLVYTTEDLHSISIGWQHTDRIHYFDTDYVSISVTLSF